jgi:dolichol-phosphate mannosyltransferase
MSINTKLEKNFISVVVYVKNHEKYIADFIDKVTIILKENFERSEVIFVNDYSSDRTVNIIKEKFKQTGNIACTVINLSYEHQVERAMVAGQDVAIGDFVYEFDTPIIDYNIDEIMGLYYTCLKGFDIVSASSNINKVSSKLFYKVFEKYSKNNVILNSERFRIISRRGINRIKNISQTIPYRKAIYFNCGLKAKNITFTPINNMSKEVSALKTPERLDFAADNLLFFTNIGWKISSSMSIAMVLFSVIIGIYTFVTWIVNKNVVTGWTTTMMFLAIAFSGLFVLMTIAIKYLSLILFVNINKQDYVFESVEKIK